MGSIGNPIITGLVQAAQAQQVASRDRDRSRAAESSTKERADKLDLRVNEAEAPEAVRDIREEDEHPQGRRRQPGPERTPETDADADADAAATEPGPEDRPSLDLQA